MLPIQSVHISTFDVPEQNRIAPQQHAWLDGAERLQARRRHRLALIEPLPRRIRAAASSGD